jgi:EmrB/QacA subfamily drug resistance transporter
MEGGKESRGSRVDKRAVLLAAATASFLTPFMASSINIAIPSIGREFAADPVTLSWVSTTYLVAAATFLVPFGKLADIHGRRKVFLAGIAGYTVVSLLCGLAPSLSALLALRALQGFTDAMMFGTSMAIVTSVYPPPERGRALGINVAAVYAGAAAGPFIGGLMTELAGWRSIFILTTVLGLWAVSLTLWKIRDEWAEARGQRMDVAGALLYAVALVALMNGFRLLPGTGGVWLVAGGVACLAGFVAWEKRTAYPVLDIALFQRNTVFAMSNLSAFLNYAATFALTFLLSLYLQYVKGLNPRSAGELMLVQPVIMAVFSPLAGRLSDRIEPRVVASIGMGLSAAGLFLTSFIDGSTGLLHVAFILAVCGLGFAFFSSPNTSAIMGSVDRVHYGVASATTGVMRLVGQTFSMATAGLILGLYVGQAQVTRADTSAFLAGLRAAFLVFAALCGAGVFASLARGNLRKGGR